MKESEEYNFFECDANSTEAGKNIAITLWISVSKLKFPPEISSGQ